MHGVDLPFRRWHKSQIQREQGTKDRTGDDDAAGVSDAMAMDDWVHDDGKYGSAGDGGGKVNGAGFGETSETTQGDGEKDGKGARLEFLLAVVI